uniref:HDC16926 n=1 Tax=Drosophila melanogaster TaxID=7227 RepID=Q6IIU5_DROME|nr:TPA_inf: HDC16926 [Drosophila melanogaster]
MSASYTRLFRVLFVIIFIKLLLLLGLLLDSYDGAARLQRRSNVDIFDELLVDRRQTLCQAIDGNSPIHRSQVRGALSGVRIRPYTRESDPSDGKKCRIVPKWDRTFVTKSHFSEQNDNRPVEGESSIYVLPINLPNTLAPSNAIFTSHRAK